MAMFIHTNTRYIFVHVSITRFALFLSLSVLCLFLWLWWFTGVVVAHSHHIKYIWDRGKGHRDREIRRLTDCSTLYLSSPLLHCMWVNHTVHTLHTVDGYSITWGGLTGWGLLHDFYASLKSRELSGYFLVLCLNVFKCTTLQIIKWSFIHPSVTGLFGILEPVDRSLFLFSTI